MISHFTNHDDARAATTALAAPNQNQITPKTAQSHMNHECMRAHTHTQKRDELSRQTTNSTAKSQINQCMVYTFSIEIETPKMNGWESEADRNMQTHDI